jgi:carbon-monoxide dehydrogenase large subunit
LSHPLLGTARYTADVPAQDALHVAFLRSDHAHADLVGLDCSGALEVPGVVAVLTAEDLEPLGDFPAFLRQPTVDGRPLVAPRRPVLCEGRVRHVGELIAMVVAESRAAAIDGVEAIVPDFEERTAVVSLDAAGLPDIHDDAPGNTAARVAAGDAALVASAMAAAQHVVETDIYLPRMSPVPLEPLSAVASHDPDTGYLDLWTPHQGIAEQRRDICAVLGVPPDRVRVHADRVGGAFGVRGAAFPETIALLAAARKLGRTLRWQGTRSEGFLGDYHGRGMRLSGRLALDENLRFTAIDVAIEADLGAYVHPVGAHISVNNPLATLTGCYRIPDAAAEIRLAFTNAVPLGPFRGAGRPEIALLVERLVDEAAAATGFDPLELRALNAVAPGDFPYATPVGFTYDSGDYPRLVALAQKASNWDGFAARAQADARQGRLRGIGAALFVEVAGGGGAPSDSVRLEIEEADGAARIAIVTATQSTGQDHEGLFRGLLTSQIAIPDAAIVLRQSQSEDTPPGLGSFGSRTTIQAGSALQAAGKALVADLVAREAARRDLPPDELSADPQAIRDRSGEVLCTLAEALDRAAREGGVRVTGTAPVVNTFPSGCHVAEVRIDPETGQVDCVGYWAVDDAGRVMSHHALEGQIRGGIAQGIAGALMDGHSYDRDGQLLTGTLMDYTLPRAGDMPAMQVFAHDVPSPTNPLGVKGAGEAGTTGALAATCNAVADALRRVGIGLPEIPLTPAVIWHALQTGDAANRLRAATGQSPGS